MTLEHNHFFYSFWSAMNRDVNEYRVFCNTENKYVYTWSDRAPVSCPNNGSHTIDLTKVSSVGKLPLTVFPTTSFEELRVAERTTIIELKSVFGKSSLRDVYVETGTATITNNVGDAEYNLKVIGANDEAWLRSAERGRYVAGLQGEVGIACRLPEALTGNQTLKIGLFDETNGFYFMHSSNVMSAVVLRDGTANVIPMTSFNVDKFDGTGPSRYVLDPTDGIIYTIRFSWYGYGNIEFRLNTTNAELKQSSWLGHIYNPQAQTSVKTPNLPISIRLQNNGTVATRSSFVAGRQYSLLGKYDPITRVNSAYRTGISVNSSTTFVHIVSIRRKTGYLGNPIKAFSVDAIATSDVILQIRTQCTLTGPSWVAPNDTNASDTAIECDTTSSAVTGGKPIWTGLLGGTRGVTSRLEIDFDLPEYDTLTLVAKSVTGGNNVMSCVFRWTEGW